MPFFGFFFGSVLRPLCKMVAALAGICFPVEAMWQERRSRYTFRSAEVLFQLIKKVLCQKEIHFYICHKRRGAAPHSLLLFGSLLGCLLLVWLGDGFPTVIGQFSGCQLVGFPPL